MALGGTASHGLLSLSSQAVDMTDFDAIKISIASPERIRSWSCGEVTKPETINYRTFKPERDGLFCARIFGPVKDYECLCGKYKRIKYKGIVCEKCGVEVTSSKVRRERMGHIELAAPVAHVWFLKSLPSRISTLLDITLKNIERVVYFEAYVVTDAKLTPLTEGEIITEDQYDKYQEEYGYGSFDAKTGAEGIQDLLANLDLAMTKTNLRQELSTTSSVMKKEKIVKRLKLVEQFLESGNKPEWMIMSVLPVIPPDIRPLVMLDGGRFATSDLNELYRRVINRNNRLKRLLALEAPEIIIRNEKRMLQESVDALLDNGRSGNAARNANRKLFKSLSDMLKGKSGRFRQNLLGKRVDYSGRSVIVVGPELKLYQCGLPKKMALELFKPFIYSKLELYGLSPSIKVSKKMVESGRPEVWDMLDEVIRQHPVLLNRAPTLHRLGIQAFEPKLTEGKAIQLHPLVCAAFNADFDGDQMAVHVPLSIEAQTEARVLMMSTNNILSPQNGKPIITPSQDMVLGLYYLTKEDPANKKIEKPLCVSGDAELDHALFNEVVTLHTKINYRYAVTGKHGEKHWNITETTPGRVKLYNILPEVAKKDFSLANNVMTKKMIKNLIDKVYRIAGPKETVIFCDRIMALGFKFATHSGISLGKDNMVVPADKAKMLDESMEKVKTYEKQFREGLITDGERYNKVIDEWTTCGAALSEKMLKTISKEGSPDEMNDLFMMANSGARGSETQIKQLAAMRGLMAKATGEIIEIPIKSNFKEGLSVLEYFTSAHGARKGLIDTALKTANSGYLTRRLVDVAQDCIVIEDDCGTDEGITVEAMIEDGRIVIPMKEKVLGRTLAADVIDPKTEKVAIKADTLVDEELADKIEKLDLKKVSVRSPLTCKTKNGICAKCYGRDLATGDLVSTGEAVGVIAAQSIGEPGTQLTMRTFHVGGVAMKGVDSSSVTAPDDGVLKIKDKRGIVRNRDGFDIIVKRICEIVLYDNEGKEINRYKLPYGAKIMKEDGAQVAKGDRIAEWDPYSIPVVAEKDGAVEFHDLIENISMRERVDESTGVSTKIVVEWKQHSKKELKPAISLTYKLRGKDKESKIDHLLAVNTIINVSNGEDVKKGDIIARIPKASTKTKDITGGLPRVAELFEARMPKNYAIMSEIDGVVEFGKDYKVKRKLIIKPTDDSMENVEYMIPKGKHLFVGEGDEVKRGDILVDGNMVPHDILRILGVEEFAKYITTEIQKVYTMQGVGIHDKHIEIILNMMLQKVEVVDSGETTLLKGEYVDREDFAEINAKADSEGLKVATAKPVLLGITKASLHTKSFISAASFQETTRVLTDAAVQGKADKLHGLKENIIVGRLIPAGTGLMLNKYKKQAADLVAAEEEELPMDDE